MAYDRPEGHTTQAYLSPDLTHTVLTIPTPWGGNRARLLCGGYYSVCISCSLPPVFLSRLLCLLQPHHPLHPMDLLCKSLLRTSAPPEPSACNVLPLGIFTDPFLASCGS